MHDRIAILCAGTDGVITGEDMLAGGAIVERMHSAIAASWHAEPPMQAARRAWANGKGCEAPPTDVRSTTASPARSRHHRRRPQPPRHRPGRRPRRSAPDSTRSPSSPNSTPPPTKSARHSRSSVAPAKMPGSIQKISRKGAETQSKTQSRNLRRESESSFFTSLRLLCVPSSALCAFA